MIKLLNTKLDNAKINSAKVIDDNLYILYRKNVNNLINIEDDGEEVDLELNLLKISLTTKKSYNKHILTDLNDKIKNSKIIDNNIYVFEGQHLYIYDFNFNLVRNIDNTINVFKINEEMYFIKRIGSFFHLTNDDDYIFLTIKVFTNKNYIENIEGNDVLYLTRYIYNNVHVFEDFIVFDDGLIILYNPKTKESHQLNNVEEFKTFSTDYVINKYNIDSNEQKFMNNDVKLKNLSYIGENYYLEFNEKTFEAILYYKHEKIKNLGEKIKIGTEEKQVEISINLLKENSEYIRGLLNDYENVEKELIHSSFENIEIYYKFINNEKIMNHELYNLFKICNFLQDKNINIISDMINEYIEYNNIEIDEIFEYLKLFSTSIYKYNMKIIYIILRKYKFDDIMKKFSEMDKNTEFYNLCFRELLKISIDCFN